MEKPFVIANKEMRERITKAVNESIEEIPAEIIADFLEKIAGSLRVIAERQYEEASKVYEAESDEKNADIDRFNNPIVNSEPTTE